MTDVALKYINSQKGCFNRYYAIQKVRLMKRLLSMMRNNRILDFGCGAGYVEAEYRREAKCIDSVDIVNHQLYGVASLQAIPNKEYDIILLLDVIEHIKDKVLTIADLTKHLVPGGYMVVTIPTGMFWKLLKPLRFLFGANIQQHIDYGERELTRDFSGYNIKHSYWLIPGMFKYYVFTWET